MMGRRRRSRYEIIYLILEKCIEKSTITQISYYIHSNFKQTRKYIDNLASNGYLNLVVDDDGNRYYTTEKGLLLMNKIKNLLSDIK